MKTILILSLFILACQSQADKDRERMQWLIDADKRLSGVIESLYERRHTVVDSMLTLYLPKYDNPDRDSLESDAQYKTKVFLKPNTDKLKLYQDSLEKVKTEIQDLKLLMGK
jgi:hypothetical protein